MQDERHLEDDRDEQEEVEQHWQERERETGLPLVILKSAPISRQVERVRGIQI